MFIIKKIITPFLLPPGIFMCFLLFVGVWFFFKKNRKAGIVNLIIAGLMWLLSISPVTNVMLRNLEADFNIPRNPQGDVIILLSGGINDKAPDLTGLGAPSEDMLGRLFTTVRLQKRLNIPIIISGGKVFKHRSAEAPIIKRFLLDLGVSSNDIIKEDKSRDTFENAKYTRDICDHLGFKKPILVTSAFHMKRSISVFKKIGIEVLPFPCNFKSWRDRQYIWVDYLPNAYGFYHASIFIREFLGSIFYKFAY